MNSQAVMDPIGGSDLRRRPAHLGEWSVADPLAAEDWDGQLGSRAGATFFHTSGWARVLVETYKYKPHYITDGDAGGPLMALMEVNSPITGRRGVSLPFADEVPLLGGEEGKGPALVEAAIGMAARLGWRSVQWRSKVLGIPEAVPCETFCGHRLDLTAGPSRLFDRLDSAARRAVRKAEQMGLETRVETSVEAMRGFYRLHGLTRQRQGVPLQPWRFFHNIQRYICEHDRGVLLSTFFNGRRVASALFVQFGKRVLYKFGASDRTFQHLRGNNLVIWNAIEWFCGKGMEELTFGRTDPGNEGLRRFKESWGSREYPIHYYKVYTSPGSFARPGKRRICNVPIFKRLPVWCLRLMGCLAYRHVG